MPSETPAVSIQNLRKQYRRDRGAEPKEALKGIDLEIPRGSFFGLLGPNGAGKSTLINILSGLVVKTSGQAAICGYDIEKQMRGARMSLGVVPQELVLDTFFTVREALDIHAGYYGIRKAQRRTDEIIDAMGLNEQADMKSRLLSGGMRRRLLIGKALVHNPPVLILDEPTAGVDVELRSHLWEYVRKLNAQGTTILLTTHYLEEAEELCDTIAIINHGRVIACDSKAKLMEGFDSKRLIIYPCEPLATLPPALAEYGWELQEDGSLYIRYQPSEANVEALIAQIRGEQIQIRDLSTEETELEEIFRHLTSEQHENSTHTASST